VKRREETEVERRQLERDATLGERRKKHLGVLRCGS
jgi:hypothetical protein